MPRCPKSQKREIFMSQRDKNYANRRFKQIRGGNFYTKKILSTYKAKSKYKPKFQDQEATTFVRRQLTYQ